LPERHKKPQFARAKGHLHLGRETREAMEMELR
jgi:hypothetical protein